MDDVVPPSVRMETDTSSIRDVATVAPIGPGGAGLIARRPGAPDWAGVPPW